LLFARRAGFRDPSGPGFRSILDRHRIQRAPQIPGGDAAPGPPADREFAHRGGARPLAVEVVQRERALQADPLAESLARRLIAALLACGERAEALRAWHQCKTMLRLHGAAPSRDTLALVRQADFAV